MIATAKKLADRIRLIVIKYEGRFGNGAPFAFYVCIHRLVLGDRRLTTTHRAMATSSICRFFHLCDCFIDFLHGRVQFFQDFVLLFGKVFNAARLLLQFFQHGVLPF